MANTRVPPSRYDAMPNVPLCRTASVLPNDVAPADNFPIMIGNALWVAAFDVAAHKGQSVRGLGCISQADVNSLKTHNPYCLSKTLRVPSGGKLHVHRGPFDAQRVRK